MTSPLEFLETAHKQAEEVARAAADDTASEWSNGGGSGDGVCTKHGTLVAVGPYTGYLSDGVRQHIVLHDPAAVLRRIAKERELLAGHERYVAFGVARCRDRGIIHDLFPCATVRLLAEAWGWTEEEQR